MRLILIPSFIGESSVDRVSVHNRSQIYALTHFIVERERTARAFLKSIAHPIPQSELVFYELDKHADYAGFKPFFNAHISSGIGLISEAGLPAVADPGSAVVSYAHQKGADVLPLGGSSSIFLALMASGMDGQHFAFHGYLPINAGQRMKAIKRMEQDAAKATQIFMEAPYRNNAFLDLLITNLKKGTRLCVACDLETTTQVIVSKPVDQWKKGELDLHKRPCIFLIKA